MRSVAGQVHRDICTIYNIEESDGQPFLATGFLEGQTLKHRISRKPFPLDSLLDRRADCAPQLTLPVL
jgi:hypothetical protein